MNYDNAKNIESKMLELNIKLYGKLLFFSNGNYKDIMIQAVNKNSTLPLKL